MSQDSNKEVRPVRSLADLNARNRDQHPPVPLPNRDREGNLVDPRFPATQTSEGKRWR